MVYEWNKLGYISQDAISDDTAVSAKVKSGAYMSMLSQGKPGYKTQISGECGRPMVVFCIEEEAFRPSSTCNKHSLVYQPEFGRSRCRHADLQRFLYGSRSFKPYLLG